MKKTVVEYGRLRAGSKASPLRPLMKALTKEIVMENPRILILTHGGWGMHLVESLNMILGNIDCCEEIALTPKDTFVEYYNKVKEHVATFPQGSLILTDLFGGTTSNVAAKVAMELNMKAYCGLSAPLLLEACSQIQFQGCLNFEVLLTTGQGACRDMVEEIRNLMKEKEEA